MGNKFIENLIIQLKRTIVNLECEGFNQELLNEAQEYMSELELLIEHDLGE